MAGSSTLNLSLLSRGVGEVTKNGHEKVEVVLEPEDYFNWAKNPNRLYLPPLRAPYPSTGLPIRSIQHAESLRIPSTSSKDEYPAYIPKTFTTRKGALLLFSEDMAVKNKSTNASQEHGDHFVSRSMNDVDLRTVEDLAKSILSYGMDQEKGCGVYLGFVHPRRLYKDTRQMRPGFSAKRYLATWTRSWDDSLLHKLLDKGSISDGSLQQYNSFIPNKGMRLNDDLSHFPAPYRLLRTMLLSPGSLSGYTFYRMRPDSELSARYDRGKDELGGLSPGDEELRKGPLITREATQGTIKIVQLKQGETTELEYNELDKNQQEDVLTDLLVKSAIHHALKKQQEYLDESFPNIAQTKRLSAVSESDVSMVSFDGRQKTPLPDFNMREAVDSLLDSQKGRPLFDGSSLPGQQGQGARKNSLSDYGSLKGRSVPQYSSRSFEAPRGRPYSDEIPADGHFPVITTRSYDGSSTGSSRSVKHFGQVQHPLPPIADEGGGDREDGDAETLQPSGHPVLPPIIDNAGDLAVPTVNIEPPTPQHSTLTNLPQSRAGPPSREPSIAPTRESGEEEEEEWGTSIHEEELLRREKEDSMERKKKESAEQRSPGVQSQKESPRKGPVLAGGSHLQSSRDSLGTSSTSSQVHMPGTLPGWKGSQQSLKSGHSQQSKKTSSLKSGRTVKGSVVYAPGGEIINVGGAVGHAADATVPAFDMDRLPDGAELAVSEDSGHLSDDEGGESWRSSAQQPGGARADGYKKFTQKRDVDVHGGDLDAAMSMHSWSYAAKESEPGSALPSPRSVPPLSRTSQEFNDDVPDSSHSAAETRDSDSDYEEGVLHHTSAKQESMQSDKSPIDIMEEWNKPANGDVSTSRKSSRAASARSSRSLLQVRGDRESSISTRGSSKNSVISKPKDEEKNLSPRSQSSSDSGYSVPSARTLTPTEIGSVRTIPPSPVPEEDECVEEMEQENCGRDHDGVILPDPSELLENEGVMILESSEAGEDLENEICEADEDFKHSRDGRSDHDRQSQKSLASSKNISLSGAIEKAIDQLEFEETDLKDSDSKGLEAPSRKSSASAVEQGLIDALTEHAQKIAASVLKHGDSGQDLANDIKKAANLWMTKLPTRVLSRSQSVQELPDNSTVEEIARMQKRKSAAPTVAEYKELIRQTLSSVVAKQMGMEDGILPDDAEISQELMEALTNQSLTPQDLEVVRSDSGKSIIRAKSAASNGLKEGHLYQPARKGSHSSSGSPKPPISIPTDRQSTADIGPLDVVNIGTAEVTEGEAEELTVLSGDGKSRLPSARSTKEDAILSSPGEVDQQSLPARSQGSGKSQASVPEAKTPQQELAEALEQAQSPDKKSQRSDTKSKSSIKSKTSKTGLEDREEFVVGKVADKKELEKLYAPVEPPPPPKEEAKKSPVKKSPTKTPVGKPKAKKKAETPSPAKKVTKKKKKKKERGSTASTDGIKSPGEETPSVDEKAPSPVIQEAVVEEKTQEAVVEEKTQEAVVEEKTQEAVEPDTVDVDEPIEENLETLSPVPSKSGSEDSGDFHIVRDIESSPEPEMEKGSDKYGLSPTHLDVTEDEDGSTSDASSSHLQSISNKDARAAKRTAQAEKRRLQVERKRREREEQIKREREEMERQEQLKRELEETRRRKEEERRLKKQREEEEMMEEDEREKERERRVLQEMEREKRMKEEYQRKLEEMKRKQAELDRIRLEEELERQREEELKRLEEEEMLYKMAEQERIEYERKKREDAERKRKEDELARIRREEEAARALEEAKKLAEEMARKQAELEARLKFNRSLMVESKGLDHTQDVTRAFVYSYFELLQWLGLDIPEFDLQKIQAKY